MCGDEELGERSQLNRGGQFKLKLASRSEDGGSRKVTVKDIAPQPTYSHVEVTGCLR
jgi:hypothetical protein